MNDHLPSTTHFAVRFGIFTGLASVIYYIALFISNLYPFYQSVANVILIVGIYYGIQEFKAANKSFMTYMQGLGVGFMLSTVTGIIVGFMWLGYLSFNSYPIEKDMNSTVRYYEKQLEAGEYTQEEVDESLARAKFMYRPGMYFLNYALSYFIIGSFFSLIISAFMRNNPPS